MNIISLENISKSYSEKALIENISLGINEGDKIGLIGINGTGKSTLLKIIAGIESIDSGNIIKANRARIEYLSQNPEYDDSSTVLQQIFKGNSPEFKLLRKYEEVLHKLQEKRTSEELEALNKRLISLQSSVDTMNLWDLESEAKTVLTKLGINEFNAVMGELSGGQRKRVALASALITPCDLLILDEPTNHMDNESIDWLENYLNGRKGALLMVTHDRYFLDRIANRIIELDCGNLYSYEGNYSLFIEKKLEREALEAASEEKRQNLLRKELAWVKRGAKARSTKQKARLQRFEELSSIEGPQKAAAADISSLSSRLGRKVIEIKDISITIEGKLLIKDFTYTLLRDDRIGIVGPNGIGKSTLMRIISGELKPDKGTIDIGDTVKLGFFSQENQHMDENMRVIEYVREEAEFIAVADGEKISASQMCERFLFDSTMQWTPIGKLSGGERRRLYLLRVLMKAPNVLLLDEPSNDLDIETLKVLEDYLDSFQGAVITVSHDRYFIDRICTKIFYYEGEGRIKQYNGGYEDFIEARQQEEGDNVNNIKKSVEEKSSSVDKNNFKKEKPLKFTYKEQKEYEEIDEVIEGLENKIEECEKAMEASAADYEKLQDLMKEKELLSKELEEKYERWEYLNELAAKIEASKN
ncbi:ABC-F family ATP-binding cassette domain-containing protein [Clostridium polynesiense]|uniref:ABC-F family ATP-binding cassette domain-containing protein n=1 Tax=Clostridium polynesiense TaxID=1325933 RepID=UPI0005909F7F|nr:ABC-F family ATP-binding cassette domain-containing protein [Clostridium polynesiense]